VGLLVAFRMQGALLKGTQDQWSRRWAVGLRRAMGATALLNAKPLLHDDWDPSYVGTGKKDWS
jgi:hypothetical protein